MANTTSGIKPQPLHFHLSSVILFIIMGSCLFLEIGADGDCNVYGWPGDTLSLTQIVPVSPNDLQTNTTNKSMYATWMRTNGHNLSELCACNLSTSPPHCEHCQDPDVAATVEKLLTGNFRFNLTISSLNKTRHDSNILLDVNGNVEYNCSVEVYFVQSIPECTTQVVPQDQSQSYVAVNCSIVYSSVPEPPCTFTWSNLTQHDFNVTSESFITSDGPATSRGSAKSAIYYEKICRARIPLSSLTVGEANFTIEFSFGVNYGTEHVTRKKTISKRVVNGLPNIARNCPQGDFIRSGYIKVGTTASCQCTIRESPDQISLQSPAWLQDTRPAQGVTGNHTTATLVMRAVNHPPSSRPYICSSSDSVLSDQDHSFTPKFAYGPDEVHAKVVGMPRSVYDLCPNNINPISFSCNVTNVEPQPVVVLQVDGYYNVSAWRWQKDSQGHYSYHFRFRPLRGGALTMRCLAVNSLFPTLNAYGDVTVTVRERPSQPAIYIGGLRVKADEQRVDVVTGSQVKVRCEVHGGHPLVESVQLACTGFNSSSVMGQTVEETLTIDESNNGDNCTCLAWHVLSCYQLSSSWSFTLNVLVGASVPKFEAQVGQNGSKWLATDSDTLTRIEVDRGTHLTFHCVGDGNPRPEVTISSPSQFHFNQSRGSVSQWLTISDITCRDAGIYSCLASNEVANTKRKQLQLVVKCDLQTNGDTSSSNVQYLPYPADGSKVNVSFHVFGYPKPREYVLVHTPISDNGMAESGASKVDTQRYAVSCLPEEDSGWRVVLQLTDVSKNDAGHYTLTVENGIGDGIECNFFVGAKSSEGDSDDPTLINYITLGGMGILFVLVIFTIVLLFVRTRGQRQGGQSVQLEGIRSKDQRNGTGTTETTFTEHGQAESSGHGTEQTFMNMQQPHGVFASLQFSKVNECNLERDRADSKMSDEEHAEPDFYTDANSSAMDFSESVLNLITSAKRDETPRKQAIAEETKTLPGRNLPKQDVSRKEALPLPKRPVGGHRPLPVDDPDDDPECIYEPYENLGTKAFQAMEDTEDSMGAYTNEAFGDIYENSEQIQPPSYGEVQEDYEDI